MAPFAGPADARPGRGGEALRAPRLRPQGCCPRGGSPLPAAPAVPRCDLGQRAQRWEPKVWLLVASPPMPGSRPWACHSGSQQTGGSVRSLEEIAVELPESCRTLGRLDRFILLPPGSETLGKGGDRRALPRLLGQAFCTTGAFLWGSARDLRLPAPGSPGPDRARSQ